jgi:hypothetical protein
LAAESAVKSTFSSDIAEVRGRSTVQITAGLLGCVVHGHLLHWGAQALVVVHFENMDLSLLASSLRHVGKRKLVGQGMDNAALRGRQSGGEGHAIALGRLFEEKELRIELQHLGIVQIDICSS